MQLLICMSASPEQLWWHPAVPPHHVAMLFGCLLLSSRQPEQLDLEKSRISFIMPLSRSHYWCKPMQSHYC